MPEQKEISQTEFWAIVELMGHQRIAGKVSQSPIGGGALIRVDVPAVGDAQGFTKLVNQSAIYAITVTDEQTARAIVAYDKPKAMEAWTMQQALRALPAGERPSITDDQVDGYDPANELP